MQKVLFCNIGWMNHYNGIDGDSIDRGGSYNDSEIGWEACNFTPVGDDIFGYVEMPGEKLNIPRIGANSKDELISNILVIWLATRPQGGTVIIGWYKEATVYKFYRDFSRHLS